MRTAAIIPVLNCERTVGDVIAGARRHADNVVVVDDGSTDGTPVVLRRHARRGITVITHRTNRGKGSAIKSGIAHLRKQRGEKPEGIILLDADGEHDPDDIPRLIGALGQADLAIGIRSAHRSLSRHLLNAWMAWWFRLLAPEVRDPSCGFRAVRWSVLERMKLRTPDFRIDAEMVLEAARAGATMVSVPIGAATSAGSLMRSTDFLLINAFFDDWALRNARHLRLSLPRRAVLLAGASVGRLLGTLFAGGRKRRPVPEKI